MIATFPNSILTNEFSDAGIFREYETKLQYHRSATFNIEPISLPFKRIHAPSN